MDDAVRAGVGIFNAGGYHAAHDAWEERWLELEKGSDDERFLHGLIQFTAAVYHARNRNWSGAAGLTESAGEYLAGLPDDYRGVDVGAVRSYLRRLAADPELIERRRPPRLTYEGAALTPADLNFEAAAVAAEVLAEERSEYDKGVVESAIAFAREEREGTGTRFVTFVMDFVGDAAHRPIVYQRMREHVERRESRREDVEGLFDSDRDSERLSESDPDAGSGPKSGPE